MRNGEALGAEIGRLTREYVDKRLEGISNGRDGIDGKNGDPGAPGKDGEAPSLELVRQIIAEEVAKAFAAIQPPKDGRDGRDGRDGKDGADGRDALQIDILPTIDTGKGYPRGTFAKYISGLWRARRNTEPVPDGQPFVEMLEAAGWEVILEGIDYVRALQIDERNFSVNWTLTSGKTMGAEFSWPVLLDRGVHKSGTTYAKGDVVSRHGSMWIAQADGADADPGNGNPQWRLSVKCGRDGRDGDKGDRGEKGMKGDKGDTEYKY